MVYIGVDHADATPPVARPHGNLKRLSEQPFLLCLGATSDTRTGCSRCACSRRCATSRAGTGRWYWRAPGRPTAPRPGEEAAYLATRPDLAQSGEPLPAVSDAEKNWFWSARAAVLYPTTYEGFGLMPFEAADHDRPCLFASQTALAEILSPAELATLVPCDPHASAEARRPPPDPARAIKAHVLAIRRGRTRFTGNRPRSRSWTSTARAATAPAREATRLAEELELVETRSARRWSASTTSCGKVFTPMQTLVAPGGPLSPSAHRVARRGGQATSSYAGCSWVQCGSRTGSAAGTGEPPPEQAEVLAGEPWPCTSPGPTRNTWRAAHAEGRRAGSPRTVAIVPRERRLRVSLRGASCAQTLESATGQQQRVARKRQRA